MQTLVLGARLVDYMPKMGEEKVQRVELDILPRQTAVDTAEERGIRPSTIAAPIDFWKSSFKPEQLPGLFEIETGLQRAYGRSGGTEAIVTSMVFIRNVDVFPKDAKPSGPSRTAEALKS